MPTATFTIDSVVANRRFTLDGQIVGNRVRHDRTLDHTGTEDTTTVVLSATIGQYPAGTTIQAVLESMAARLVSIESSNHSYATFRLDAFIQPRFTLNSVLKKNKAGSGTLDAVVSLTGPKTFTLNAVIKQPATSTNFTLSAFLV